VSGRIGAEIVRDQLSVAGACDSAVDFSRLVQALAADRARAVVDDRLSVVIEKARVRRGDELHARGTYL